MATSAQQQDQVGFGTPFAGAIDHLRRKLNLPTERWDDIQRSAHDKAFIVAGAAKADLLQDLHQAVERAVGGGGLAAFRKDFDQIVASRGWTGWTGEGSAAGRAWRTATIYRTNLATSYAAGRWQQMSAPESVKLMPYWRYRHADGLAHPRPLHLAWNGLTLRYDHPFWKTHFAPNGWGCHCRIFPTEAPADGAPTEPPAGWDQIDDATGAPVGIDRGFDYAPGASVDTGLRRMVQDKLITYPPAITKALSNDLTRYLNAHDRPAAFARRALAEPDFNDTLWLGFVTGAQRLADDAGVQAQDFTLTLPASIVRHVQASHGHDGKGQRPATPQDYEHVAEVLNSADTLRAGDGNTVVALKMVVGEVFRAVFQVLPGRRSRSLSLLSLVIKTRRG